MITLNSPIYCTVTAPLTKLITESGYIHPIIVLAIVSVYNIVENIHEVKNKCRVVYKLKSDMGVRVFQMSKNIILISSTVRFLSPVYFLSAFKSYA